MKTRKNGENRYEPPSELSHRQRRALPLLATAPTWEEGCRRANLSRSALTDWMKAPAFAVALREAEDAAFRETLENVRKASGEAVEVLRDLLRSKNDAIRLGSARELLGVAIKIRELVDLEDRLSSLEKRLQEAGQ